MICVVYCPNTLNFSVSKSWFTAGGLLLLVCFSISNALPPNSFHRLLDLIIPEEEYLELPRRVVREANPESFSDYFRKLQLAQSELQKNASVGEEEIEKVFKNHGLDVGNETHDQNATTTDSPEYITKQSSSSTDMPYATSTQKPKKELCKAKSCSELSGNSTVKPQKKQIIKPEVTPKVFPTFSVISTTSIPDDLDVSNTTTNMELDSTVFPSTTTPHNSAPWWGVYKKSKPKYLKSTIARQVVNKIKTSRRRSHFD